jgi:hypothetical protein
MARRKYYRNRKEVKGIDPEALWYRHKYNMMVLVDDDRFVIVCEEEGVFYRVKISQNKKICRLNY